ncbi:MAG: ribulose-phosphate 3-epimerase [Proteobacteria bacterium]|nr:ribulose-phosphate 3-epimerase [Pseudomonadota bacterium]
MNKSNTTIIAPSVLAANFGCLESEIKDLSGAGADWLHIDVMDGSFVPPITFGDNMVATAKRCSQLPLDVHLMINHPEHHIESFKAAGASRLTIHQESCPHLHRVLGAIHGAGMAAGVAINPGTPVSQLFDVLDLVDLVLVMTVNPGWGGQKFIEQSISRITAVRNEIDRRSLSVHLQVDGGITPETAKTTTAAGASVLVAGTSVLGQKDRAAAIRALRQASHR